jgi:dihydroorotate dehydrogenase
VDATVAAVLRELIDHLRSEAPISGTAGYDEGWADAYEQVANDMEALADSIEKGGQGDD